MKTNELKEMFARLNPDLIVLQVKNELSDRNCRLEERLAVVYIDIRKYPIKAYFETYNIIYVPHTGAFY